MNFTIPTRKRGCQSAAAVERYAEEKEAFCEAILQFQSRLDFRVSARGWGYLLEGEGAIDKGQIDLVAETINTYRKSGDLPLDICAVDETRTFENLEDLDDDKTPEEQAAAIVRYTNTAHLAYTPTSFWEDQEYYVQMLVEKIDLKGLFLPICRQFRIPIGNAKGWTDINGRAYMMQRFSEWEMQGKTCVLLYCGDFDPWGLKISDSLRDNMYEISRAVGWSPENLIIDRFGLNYDYIMDHELVWIDGLTAGSGKDMADPNSYKHKKIHSFIQDYIDKYGERKVEANALLHDVAAARELCRQAVLRYVDADAPGTYLDALQEPRTQVREAVLRLLLEEQE
jgi:hypothetical protein